MIRLSHRVRICLCFHIAVTVHVLHPEAAPLPVELTSFEAQVDGDAVVLRWTTLTETNNAGFEVEQRTEGAWIAA